MSIPGVCFFVLESLRADTIIQGYLSFGNHIPEVGLCLDHAFTELNGPALTHLRA